MKASEWLFRIGFVNFLLTALFFLLSAWALYVLLKPVSKDLALLLVLLNLGGVAIWCTSQLSEYAALLLLSGADYLKAFQADQLQSLAMLFLNLYQNGYMIAQILLNLWLFPLGYLVFKSGFLPRILGILLMIGGLCYPTHAALFLLVPNFDATFGFILGLFAFAGELLFYLWLLIKGVNVEQWQQRAPESA